MAIFPLHSTLWAQLIGYGPSVALFVLNLVTNIQAGVWHTTIHVAYYSVSIRVFALAKFIGSAVPTLDYFHCNGTIHKDRLFFITRKYKRVGLVLEPDSGLSQDENDRVLKKLRTCGYLFDRISRASTALNSTFSLPILLVLCTTLSNCTTFLFFIIYEQIQPSIFGNIIFGQSIVFISNVVALGNLLLAPDNSINQVSAFKRN